MSLRCHGLSARRLQHATILGLQLHKSTSLGWNATSYQKHKPIIAQCLYQQVFGRHVERTHNNNHQDAAHGAFGRLSHLIRMIEEARTGGVRIRACFKAKAGMQNCDGEVKCTQCETYKSPRDFYRDSRRISGLRVHCKACSNASSRRYRSTLRGGAILLASSAARRARVQGFGCTVGADDVLDMLHKQSGRCFYSGVPIEYTLPNSHWRMSLERLDNNVGYSLMNCVLVAAEFNTGDYSKNKRGCHEVHGTAQWSRKKFMDVFILRDRSIDLDVLAEDVQRARMSTISPEFRHVVDTQNECSRTSGASSREELRCLGEPISKSKWYRRSYNYVYHRTLRGNLMNLLSAARRRSKLRNQTCELSFEVLLDMLWKQAGRCHYSGVPLEYLTPNSDWRMSLERLDNDLGYTRGNCVFVACEFNTPDWSRKSPRHTVYGTAQWSKEKVVYVWGVPRVEHRGMILAS